MAKEDLCKGFRSVLGNRKDIVATKDPWLRRKRDYLWSKVIATKDVHNWF